jgi:CheY-like chemotaxis protein
MPLVLVVDDNEEFAADLVTLLEMRGFAARAKGDVRQALDLLDDDPSINVVVSDVRMPAVDGLDFARVLRHRFPKLPVILMTGAPISKDDVLPRGVLILEKPFATTELVDAINVCLVDSSQ